MSIFFLGDETVKMFAYITREIVEPFLSPDIANRLAAMLNYNIVALVSPTSLEKRLANPQSYNYYPDVLLCAITDIYLNLARGSQGRMEQRFIDAIACDERSFNISTMNSTALLLSTIGYQPQKIDTFLQLIQCVQVKVEETANEYLDLGEIPEEFIDPIMSTLMRNPLILTTSGMRIDRSTLAQHLLTDPRDPFNRAPLTLEQALPDHQMKHDIELWILQKKAERILKE